MNDHNSNVLLPLRLPTRNELRPALAKVIRDIQLRHGLTDEQLGAEIHCSSSTIANVRNERTDLNQETIAKIGARFGPEILDPWSACFGGRNVPREANPDRVRLSVVTGALHKLVAATDPDSAGGVDLVHSELADMASEILALQSMANRLAARIHSLGIAA